MKYLIKSIEMIIEPHNHHIFIYRLNRGVEIYHVSVERLQKIYDLFENSNLEVDIDFYADGNVCIAYRDHTRFEWFIEQQKSEVLNER